jgi:hypothetical protein
MRIPAGLLVLAALVAGCGTGDGGRLASGSNKENHIPAGSEPSPQMLADCRSEKPAGDELTCRVLETIEAGTFTPGNYTTEQLEDEVVEAERQAQD